MQDPQNWTAARHGPAQQHPSTPKQVQEQDGLRKNRYHNNGMSPSPGWLPASLRCNGATIVMRLVARSNNFKLQPVLNRFRADAFIQISP